MDPNTPSDFSSRTGIPWIGRGRALQHQEVVDGSGRGLACSTEAPGLGRARGLPLGDTPQGRGATQPTPQPVFGRARGLLVQPDDEGAGQARGLVPAAEAEVGVARGASLASHEPQLESIPPFDTTTKRRHLREEPAPLPAHETSALVSMFRGMGIEPSKTWGRGTLPVGLY